MPDHEEASADEPEHTPNFELSHQGVIHEENWPEYEARGFQPLFNIENDDAFSANLRVTQGGYGVAHVYTGDAYDEDAQRPLRHKPGVGLYSDPDGLVVAAENERQMEAWHREREARQRASEGGPRSN